MTILVYHGKHGDEYLMADTEARLETAMRYLFKRFDGWGFYNTLNGSHPMVMKARAGGFVFIRRLLEQRVNCEYEQWSLEEAVDLCSLSIS